MISALEALERLREGNQRFAADATRTHATDRSALRANTATGQSPVAIVLGCSDSRVPAEIVFDQDIGDLFVIRIAGNVASDEAIGSAEFAAGQLGARLIIVLGHSECGAVRATLEGELNGGPTLPAKLGTIVDWIRPTVASEVESSPDADPSDLLERSIRSNVRAARRSLLASPLLAELADSDGLVAVASEYSLTSGLVDFFEGVPPL